MKYLPDNDFHTKAIKGIFEHSVDGIALLNEKGIVLEWSKGYEKISGIKYNEAIGNYVWDIIVDMMPSNERIPQKIKNIISDVKNTLTTKTISTFNRNIIDKSTGEGKVAEVRYFPVEIQQKVMMGIICRDITQDIESKSIIIQKDTKLKETEIELNSEKYRVQAVSDNLPNGSLQRLEKDLKTGELKLTFVSNTWEDTTGLEIDKSLKSFDYVLSSVSKEDIGKLNNAIAKSFNEIVKVNVEVRVNHSKKGNRWILISYNPRIVDDKIISDGFSIDITERKKIETDLENYNQELELIIKKRTNQLEILNQELTLTNEELSSTNEELSSTNEKLAVTNEELALSNKKLEAEVDNKTFLLQRLENSERTRRNFIVKSLEGIIIVGESGTILEWNNKAEEITGIKYKEVIYHSIWKIVPKILLDNDTGKLFKSFEKIKSALLEQFDFNNKEILYDAQFKIKSTYGEVKILDLSLFLIELSGSISTYGIVFNDISEKIKTLTELENYKNNLEKIVLSKTNQLIESQERLNSLSNNLPGGVIFQLVLDTKKKKLKFEFISDTVYDMFGIRAEELNNDSSLLFDLMHEDDKKLLINFKPNDYDNKFRDIEARVFLKSGEKKWIHIRLITRQIDEKFRIFEGFMLDISKRKNNEIELEDSRKKQYILNDVLQTIQIAEDIPQSIQIVLEKIGKFADVSSAYILEKSDKEKSFRTKYEWCNEGVKPTIEAVQKLNKNIINEWIETFEKFGFICVSDIKQLDKKQYEILKSFNVKSLLIIPLWSNEKIYGFVGFHECREYKLWKQADIQLLVNLSQIISTANRRFWAEKSILMSQQTLRTVMDNINANIYVTDFETRNILFANKRIKELFGEDVEGKKCWKVFKGDKEEKCAVCLNETIISGEGEYKNRKLSYEDWFPEQQKWYACHNSAIEWIDGRIVHMEYASDITNLKATETELKEAKERAEEADKLKTSFLANMSHEIRTPMNGILGFASLLQLEIDEKISPRSTQYAQIIYDNCNSLLQLLDDIIDISKLESKQVKIVKTNCNINSLFDDMLVLYKQMLCEKGKSKNVEIIFEKSEFEEAFMVDYIRLKQIVNNLVSNAIKFTDNGYIKFGFKRHENDYLLFYVKDTGIGIPKSYKDVIFDRFRRIEEHSDKNITGTGLGLAISKNLVEIMEGKIWVESEVNVGSTFFFTVKV